MLKHLLVNVQLVFMDSIVKPVPLQDSGILNKTPVSVQLQEPSGTQPTKLVIVHQDCSALNVLLVPSQGNGKIPQINVYAHHQRLSGTKQFNNANVHKVSMVQSVKHVLFQENGTTTLTPVTAQPQ
jgi:hypothetical protein